MHDYKMQNCGNLHQALGHYDSRLGVKIGISAFILVLGQQQIITAVHTSSIPRYACVTCLKKGAEMLFKK